MTAGILRATAPEMRTAKNWAAPALKIHTQRLIDEIMVTHPEPGSITFHWVPPRMDKVYTMFAGSYPDRIGNPDHSDVIVNGITSVDPRWHRRDAARCVAGAHHQLRDPVRSRALAR